MAVTLSTLVRVISVVNFAKFAKHLADPYLALYETFLEEYDPELRKKTGSYYTPAAVVAGMTRLTDEVLRTKLDRTQGFATDNVTIVDPAMWTGTYVLSVLDTVAATEAASEGPGAVPARLREAADRLVGIEIQTGPYAVAELRVAAALHRHKADVAPDGLRLYVADTLDDPFAEQTLLAATMAPIAASRRNANKMKAHEPVVVIGNPPYRENAGGHGWFVEHGAPGTQWSEPLINDFKEPGTGKYQKNLANHYIYFWRWATWKVFEAHPVNSDGVICFITTSGYLKGPGFAGMRRYLREHTSEGWIIDCTPEGHQPDVSTRIFDGVQQPVCIGIFVRRADTDLTTPASMHYRAVHGKQAAKFAELGAMHLEGPEWESVPSEWTAPFLPEGSTVWDSSPLLGDLFPWYQSGLSPNRTWVYAPLASTLGARWDKLVAATGDEQKKLFRETNASAADKVKPGLVGYPHEDVAVKDETGSCLTPVPIAYRSFDVQYVIPDDRLRHRPRPDLWRVRGDDQVYMTEQHTHPIPAGGPGLTFAAYTPDLDCFSGRGGRVLPLYTSKDSSTPNLAPGLLGLLLERLGHIVTAEDVLAYVAAITAHPAFTDRFVEDLRTPGILVPLTEDPAVWVEAVGLGRQVLWLHTRGQRFTDPTQGRPKGAPDVADTERRTINTVGVPPGAERREGTEQPEHVELELVLLQLVVPLQLAARAGGLVVRVKVTVVRVKVAVVRPILSRDIEPGVHEVSENPLPGIK